MAVPSRPRNPARLAEVQVRVARLRNPRKPFLKRGALHRHEHQPLSDALIVDITDRYVAGRANLLIDLTDATPWQRQVAFAEVVLLDAETPIRKMGHHARINDLCRQLDMTPP